MSPRPGGKLITAAGVLAHHYREIVVVGVVFYGKPHEEIFKKLQNILNSKRILMVGDSLDHDILGGFSCRVGYITCKVWYSRS